MPYAILSLNAGSSSLKFALFLTDAGAAPQLQLRGEVSDMDGTGTVFRVSDADGGAVAEETWSAVHRDDIGRRLTEWIEHHLGELELAAVGHRVVHGGRRFSAPVRIDAEVIAALEALTPLAPLHQPGSLAPVRALIASRPDLLQVACFDTAFHHGLSPPVSRYALPRAIEDAGVRRYGFHGLSYEAVAGKLRDEGPVALRQRIIVAHLGSGASLCALRQLQSADTTMGFTALDGIMMATRPGSLDPGILLYLLRERMFDLDQLESMLYHDSGLKGVSGVSSDISVLLEDGAPESRAAIDLFTFTVSRHICALASTIGGLDCLVFTGGIGEHLWQIRGAIVERLGWLGAVIDTAANRSGDTVFSTPDSGIVLRVIATDEEAVIAQHTHELYLRS